MATIGAALAAARRTIDAIDARILLAHVLGKDTTHLAAYPDAPLTPEEARAFEAAVARRAEGEPAAYITGRREFYGLEFRVTPAVLIPRPETELLVELALERIPANRPCRVLDLGTGSGCVAIALAWARPRAEVYAVDASQDALAVARENVERIGVLNVRLAHGDWYEPCGDQRFDLVVANPPYVADRDTHLAQGDLRYEPRSALVAGADGLAAIRRIVAHAGRHVTPGATFLVEHGYEHGAACRALLGAAGFEDVRTWRDLAGRERVSGGRSA